MSSILVTGANGFVGSALCLALEAKGHVIRRAFRKPDNVSGSVVVGEIGSKTDWRKALAGIDVVVHLASRVHVLNEDASASEAFYREVNLAGTKLLAENCAAVGVKRLAFLSTVKVNGESTIDRPFSEQDQPQPQDAYGITKYQAELALRRISEETGLEIVILRPPLVYGPGVRANFLRLLEWVAKGLPLPLASVNNRRSMVYLGNLVDAIAECCENPNAVGRTFLISDGEDVSTPELIRKIAIAMEKSPRLFPCPVKALAMLGPSGKTNEVKRLICSLQVNSSSLRSELGWVPPFTLDQGLRETVQWYQQVEIVIFVVG